MTRSSLTHLLSEGLEQLSMPLAQDAQQQLLAYMALLEKWNRTYNLTAVRKPLQMISRHLLDSLVIGSYLQGQRVLDVGTGPGLPGIPLAIAYPDKTFTLLDSNNKKTRFVTQAVSELGLGNVTVIQSRVEQFQPPQQEQGLFTTITARAFATIKELVSSARHLCEAEGIFLIMKGAYPVAEVDELPAGFSVTATHKLEVPGLDADRHLLVVKSD